MNGGNIVVADTSLIINFVNGKLSTLNLHEERKIWISENEVLAYNKLKSAESDL